MDEVSENEVNIKDEAQKIVRWLASALKVSSDSLCFCGTGKLFRECCENAAPEKLIPSEELFEAALKYRDSLGGQITSIPVGLFNQLLKQGTNQLPCLYPNCTTKPVSCHLIPQNVLRAAFGNHCLDYRMRDDSSQSAFIRTGVGLAGTLPVFCSKHDNELFRDIDTLGNNASSKQQFLLALKAASFSLRRTQVLLSLDSQVEIFRPVLMIQSGTMKKGLHYTIKITHLSEQYQRFCTAHTAFMHFMNVLEKEDWDSFAYLQRNIPYSGNLSYAGLVNPPHDLEKQRINTPHIPIQITLSVFARDRMLRVFFACSNNASKEAYSILFEQLEAADDQIFIAVLNNILTYHPETLFLPVDFSLSSDDFIKIKELREHAKECLVSSSDSVFDLTNTLQAVRFIKLSG